MFQPYRQRTKTVQALIAAPDNLSGVVGVITLPGGGYAVDCPYLGRVPFRFGDALVRRADGSLMVASGEEFAAQYELEAAPLPPPEPIVTSPPPVIATADTAERPAPPPKRRAK